MNEKSKVEITIFGNNYTLEGDRGYINRLADYVNQRIEERQKMSPEISSLKIAVTALLSVVDEFFTLKEKMVKGRMENEFAQKKVNGLIELIDEKTEQLRHKGV